MNHAEQFYTGDEMPTDSEKIDLIAERVDEIHDMTSQHMEIVRALNGILNTRLSELINVVAGKGMIPLDVFKWLVIFVIGFVFCIEFGVKGVADIIEIFKK